MGSRPSGSYGWDRRRSSNFSPGTRRLRQRCLICRRIAYRGVKNMTRSFRAALLSSVALMAVAGTAAAQNPSDPPARVGRLSYLEGSVSYHDAQQDSWSKAAVNTPVTTGDSLWTEPNGHNEISIGATSVRMDGNTQLDVLALDDSQTRLQIDQGRVDK